MEHREIYYYFTTRDSAEEYIYLCVEHNLAEFDDTIDSLPRMGERLVVRFANDLRQKLLRMAH